MHQGQPLQVPRPSRLATIERALTICQPVIYGVGVTLSRYLSFATTIESLLRPLVIVVVLSITSLLLARLLTRSWTWASILASLFVLFTLREGITAAVIGAFALWWLVVTLIRRIGQRPPPSREVSGFVARSSAIFSVVFLAVMAFSVWDAATNAPETHAPNYAVSGTGGPDIYLILLDGYPRADTLRETFDIDNTAFLDGLEDLGFDIATDARTNYNKTWLTMASALNGTYVDELVGDQPPPEDEPSQIRWLHRFIEEASLIGVLRDRGYTVRTVPPPFASASLTSADEYLDEGRMTEFEAKLLWSSPWAQIMRDPVASFLFETQAGYVSEALETTVRLAEGTRTGPEFLLTHVHSPHPPFVLHSPGQPAPEAPECFPAQCTLWHSTIEGLHITREDYAEGMRGQLEILNDMLLSVVRRISAADPEAVIVLFSDHGSRYTLDDPSEHFRSFLAARTPGLDGVYPDDASAVNLLRTLFTAYFGAGLEPMPYRAWYGDWSEYLRLEPFSPD
jgi:hypothetical protein